MGPKMENNDPKAQEDKPSRPFTELVDLASRQFGGSVMVASDELFAEKEHLIKPEPAESWKHMKGNRGGVYDGWETRRRWGREPGSDWVIIRLGLPGVIRGVVVDTAFFRGNYPEAITVEGCALEEHAWIKDVTSPDIDWIELVPHSPCEGNCENSYEVHTELRFTHVRLTIHPDGGVARFRVHGEAVPDPRYFQDISIDLAAIENGGLVIDQNDKFFRSAENLNSTERGWETKRRRTEGNDWFVVKLASAGYIKQIWIDTIRFIGNAPEAISLEALNAGTADLTAESVTWEGWRELMPATPIMPDTKHRFLSKEAEPITHVRFNIFPDGGLRRIHIHGFLSESGWYDLALRWFNLLPVQHLLHLLGNLGVGGDAAKLAASLRPIRGAAGIEPALKQLAAHCTRAEAQAIHDLLLFKGK